MKTALTILLLSLLASTSLLGNLKGKVLALGDSLTFGYGLEQQHSWPSLLEEKLDREFVNAGTSGATTAFGLPTLKFHLKRYTPSLVVYALGANDALRGIDPKVTYKNMKETIEFLKAKNIPVVLLGMKAPPNYGEKFPKEFESLYPKLAKEFKLPLYPFLLEGIAGNPKLNLADGIHPNKEGYKIIAQNLEPFFKDFYDAK